MQFDQMKFEVLLPDVAIEESGLYSIKQVQVLILMLQWKKWKFVFQCPDSQCNIAGQQTNKRTSQQTKNYQVFLGWIFPLCFLDRRLKMYVARKLKISATVWKCSFTCTK